MLEDEELNGRSGREVEVGRSPRKAMDSNCYDSRLKVSSQETTLVLSNTRELDRVLSTE